MSDASFQRSRAFPITRARKPARPLPAGYGLLIGAMASLGLWAALVWAVTSLIG